jgi:hypothetical protein
MKRFALTQPPIYILYTHIYSHSRIKENPSLRRKEKTDCNSSFVQKDSRLTDSDSGFSLPPKLSWGSEKPKQQTFLDNHQTQSESCIRVWRCIFLEEKTGRKWFVKIGKDAIINPISGWVCDCGRWTFGDDGYHVPVYYRIIGKVRCGRVLGCQR